MRMFKLAKWTYIAFEYRFTIAVEKRCNSDLSPPLSNTTNQSSATVSKGNNSGSLPDEQTRKSSFCNHWALAIKKPCIRKDCAVNSFV